MIDGLDCVDIGYTQYHLNRCFDAYELKKRRFKAIALIEDLLKSASPKKGRGEGEKRERKSKSNRMSTLIGCLTENGIYLYLLRSLCSFSTIM